MTPIKKIRLDVVMVERGLTETRDMAQRLIRAGEVPRLCAASSSCTSKPRIAASVPI